MHSPLVDHLVELLGHRPALDLLRAYGGRRLRVPCAVDPTHPLAMAIGTSPAERLTSAYAGDTLELPAERNLLIDVRNRQIAAALSDGASVRGLAREYGISPRHVRTIGRKYSERSRPPICAHLPR